MPKCLNNLSLRVAIKTPHGLFTALQYSRYEIYVESLMLITAGRELEYKGILKYVRMIDLQVIICPDHSLLNYHNLLELVS